MSTNSAVQLFNRLIEGGCEPSFGENFLPELGISNTKKELLLFGRLCSREVRDEEVLEGVRNCVLCNLSNVL
jgi:hypothetical protein